MKSIVFLVVLMAAMCNTMSMLAQQNATDSTQHFTLKPDSLGAIQHVSNGYDSLLKTDDLLQAGKLSRYSDSLKILTWGDSMRMKVNSHFAKGKALANPKFLKGHSPDSLEKLALSTNKYKRKTDSLLKVTDPSSRLYGVLKKQQDSLKSVKIPGSKYVRKAEKAAQKQQKMLSEVTTKQTELHQKVTGRYNKWESGLRSKLKLDSFGIKGTGGLPGLKQLNATGTTPNVPGIKSPGGQSLPGMPKMPALNTADFSNLGLSKDLSSIGGNMSIPSTAQLGQWEKNIPGLGNNPLKDVSQKMAGANAMLKDPSKSAENALSQVGDVQTLNKEIASAEKLKSSNEAMQIADKMKNSESMQAEIKKQAVNHFAGKEDVLKKSMDEMAKYKKKYHSLNSLADAKKMKWWQPVNGLKGKPFRERFHPGVNLGYSTRKDTLNLDFYPNVSYQISGRFDIGAGALYRVHINTKNVAFDQASPVWGLTAFTTFKLFKSTLFRLETDAVNSPLPKSSADAPADRTWRWQLIMGIQNNFKISKTVTGNMQMLYNFDKNLKDGFPERLMVRVGVSFNLKKRVVISK
ncbi:MAG TPA: hypothetical protein VG737_11030 [Cyclobacteriaceae bacterium]|nr:hypothetical protein [Cyclobacteriaceae bacterium]